MAKLLDTAKLLTKVPLHQLSDQVPERDGYLREGPDQPVRADLDTAKLLTKVPLSFHLRNVTYLFNS